MLKSQINPTVQDYLRSVYRLVLRDGKTTNTALAKDLNISSAAVTDMVQRLAARKLLRYRKYQGPTLTKSGMKIALNITRRHRLWEVFLIRHLGFKWDEVHELAHELEHIGADSFIDKLDTFLGNPTHDPHGDPIPTSEGVIIDEGWTAIAALTESQSGTVMRLYDDIPDLLRYATSVRLSIGSKVDVLERILFDGSVRITSGGSEYVISEKLASSVFVKIDNPVAKAARRRTQRKVAK